MYQVYNWCTAEQRKREKVISEYCVDKAARAVLINAAIVLGARHLLQALTQTAILLCQHDVIVVIPAEIVFTCWSFSTQALQGFFWGFGGMSGSTNTTDIPGSLCNSRYCNTPTEDSRSIHETGEMLPHKYDVCIPHRLTHIHASPLTISWHRGVT